MRAYTRLTTQERYYIYLWYYEQKVSLRQIAIRLGRTPRTVYNEVKYNRRRPDVSIDKIPYDPEYADWAAAERRSAKRRGLIQAKPATLTRVRKAVEDKHWSIPMIAHGMKDTPCETRLYRYLKREIPALRSYVKQKRRTPKTPLSEVMKSNRESDYVKEHSIDKRPEAINRRLNYGHWEMDCIDSPKGVAASLLVLAERKTRYTEMIKITNKHSDQLVKALKQFLNRQKGNVMSITTDRGHEFTNFDVASFLKGQNIDVYYTHAYSPSEKGMIERINRDIRAYFPKKTSFASVTPAQIDAARGHINHYPRRVLRWTSALRNYQTWMANKERRGMRQKPIHGLAQFHKNGHDIVMLTDIREPVLVYLSSDKTRCNRGLKQSSSKKTGLQKHS
ncbi:IS30 family transposase [Weissella cibaria]|uniref:IS30 family transposase n=1 Tax=Weissella cibaria TaxID=137591 RepID=UPI00143F57BB|nr:IS30 family transposase [Weissella cibaria]NKN30855.1 IS30 family transposase [Weissella cibaria]NKN79734.1 IS30 family transposase [Weissella cibaria]NKN97891.1 IS30 family transposase [Weissella cibaria]NKO00031.1 IS30 family transposase [Weissella cibaria]